MAPEPTRQRRGGDGLGMSPRVSLLVSDTAGGGLLRATLLAQVLQTLNYRVQVIGPCFGEGLYAAVPKNIPIYTLAAHPYPRFLSQLWHLLNQVQGDLLYACKPTPTSFGLGLLQRWRRRRPLLLDMDDWEMSWHGGDDWRYRPTPKQLYRDMVKPQGALRSPNHPLYVRWLEGWVQRADGLTVDTTFLQRRFGGVYVPNGKDTDGFDPTRYNRADSRAQLGLEPYRVLMFPGAPRPHKGVEDMLVALDQLNDDRFRLVIVGGSPYDDYDQQLAQRWGRWLIRLPRCGVEAMPSVLAAADVVVVPQRDTLTARAQFPLKLTDGMAMAKPVLSTRVGDIPEILGDTGYLADPGQPAQLGQQLRLIFADEAAAQRRGLAARQRCVSLYSVGSMAKALSAVLDQALGRR